MYVYIYIKHRKILRITFSEYIYPRGILKDLIYVKFVYTNKADYNILDEIKLDVNAQFHHSL